MRDHIISYITEHHKATAKELVDELGISKQALYRYYLTPMTEAGILEKIGKPPRVFYVLAQRQFVDAERYDIPVEALDVLRDRFLFISARGERIDGVQGFLRWCVERDFDPVTKSVEYLAIQRKYDAFKQGGLISGMEKMRDTFKEVCLADVWYADFYAWEVFGKTRRGQLTLYAKQSQDREMISELATSIRPMIELIIEQYRIDAVGFIPPTVKRDVQIMKELERALALPVSIIDLVKIQTEAVVPQKSLSRLRDRIENADHTIYVQDKRQFRNVLLIDDAVGSGATINQVACKLMRSHVAEQIFGFAIVGSAKGFDVISEV